MAGTIAYKWVPRVQGNISLNWINRGNGNQYGGDYRPGM